jgi:hypothetical protein
MSRSYRPAYFITGARATAGPRVFTPFPKSLVIVYLPGLLTRQAVVNFDNHQQDNSMILRDLFTTN